jgi:hypothetical protein
VSLKIAGRPEKSGMVRRCLRIALKNPVPSRKVGRRPEKSRGGPEKSGMVRESRVRSRNVAVHRETGRDHGESGPFIVNRAAITANRDRFTVICRLP